MSSPRKSRDPRTLRPATRLVHGGAMRSQFEETSEALFLTQGYLYDTMAEAEARFKATRRASIYSRSPIRRWRCSSSAWRCSRARRRRAPPPAAWRR